MSVVIDHEGNRISALHCWNGHYKSLDLVESARMPTSAAEMTPEKIRSIIPFIGFIKIEEPDADGAPKNGARS